MSLKILVIQTAFLGDVILTLPMIQKLIELHPEAVLDVLAIPSTEVVFKASPYVKNTFVIDKNEKHKSLLKTISFALNLRKNNYDWVISPHRSFRSGLITFIIQAKYSVAFDISSFRVVYKKLVKYERSYHEVQRNFQLIGVDTNKFDWRVLPELRYPDGLISKVESYISGFDGEQIVAIAPGSVWETKKYPIEYLKKIIKQLIELKIKIVLIGGAADSDLCEGISSIDSECILSCAGKFTPVETVALLKNCSLLISNDSAPTHMGVSADIPTITLFCSTVREFGFYPYHEKGYILSYDNLECKPCGIHGLQKCPTGTFDCGNKLLPEKVLSLVRKVLDTSI